jgi:hypothetical protein
LKLLTLTGDWKKRTRPEIFQKIYRKKEKEKRLDVSEWLRRGLRKSL